MRKLFEGIAIVSVAIEVLAGLCLLIPPITIRIAPWFFSEAVGQGLHDPGSAMYFLKYLVAASCFLAAILQWFALRWVRDDREEGHLLFHIYGAFLLVGGVLLFVAATRGQGPAWAFLIVDALRGLLLAGVSLIVQYSPNTLAELRLPTARLRSRSAQADRGGERTSRSSRSRGSQRSRDSRESQRSPRSRGGRSVGSQGSDRARDSRDGRGRAARGRSRGRGGAEGVFAGGAGVDVDRNQAETPDSATGTAAATSSRPERRSSSSRSRRGRTHERSSDWTGEGGRGADPTPADERAADRTRGTDPTTGSDPATGTDSMPDTDQNRAESSRDAGRRRSRRGGRSRRRPDASGGRESSGRGSESAGAAPMPAQPAADVPPRKDDSRADRGVTGEEPGGRDQDRRPPREDQGGPDGVVIKEVPIESGRRPRRGRSVSGAVFRPREKRVRRR